MSGEVYTITQPVQDVITDTWAVKVASSVNVSQLATQLGAQNLGQIGSLTGYYLFRVPGSATQSGTIAALFSANPQMLWFEQQVTHQQSKRENIDSITPYPSQENLADATVVSTAKVTADDMNIQDNASEVSLINTLPVVSSPEPAQTAVTIIQSFPKSSPSFTPIPVSTKTNISLLTSPIPAQTTNTQRPQSSIPTRSVQPAKIAALLNEPSLIPATMILSVAHLRTQRIAQAVAAR